MDPNFPFLAVTLQPPVIGRTPTSVVCYSVRKVLLFSTVRSFHFISMHFHWRFSETTQQNKYILTIMDRYSKPARLMPTIKTKSTHMENLSISLACTIRHFKYLPPIMMNSLPENSLKRYAHCLVLSSSRLHCNMRKPKTKPRHTRRWVLPAFHITPRKTKTLGLLHITAYICIQHPSPLYC